MIKLTEFTQVVDIYKKNFNLRKKKFVNQKKRVTVEKREKREARIEVKKVFGIDKLGNKVAEKSGNLLDNAIRFAGFALLGVIVKNIDKIARFAKTIIDKIKEYAIQFKNYFDNTLKPIFLQIFNIGKVIGGAFVGITKFVIDIFPFNELSDLLSTVMSGILAIGYRIANFYKPFTSPTSPGLTSPPGDLSRETKTPSKVKTPASQQIVDVRATKVTRAIVPQKAAAPIPVGAGSGKGTTKIPFSKAVQELDDEARGKSIEELRKDSNSVDSNIKKAADAELKRRSSKSKQLKTKTYRVDPNKISNIFEEQTPQFKSFYEYQSQEDAIKQGLNRSSFGTSGRTGQQILDDLIPKRFSFKYFTQGLDFRIDIGKVIREQIFDPKNLFKNITNIGVGIGIDIGAKVAASIISNITPYERSFQLLGGLGMVNPERIYELSARKLLELPENQRKKEIEKLQEYLTSTDFIMGEQKRKMAESILNFVEIFSKKEKPRVQSITPPTAVPGTSKQPVDPKKPPGVPYSDQEYVYPDGSTLKPGDIVGSVNNINGLDGATTYGSDRGMMISREVTYVLQTIEKEVLVPA